MFDSIVSFLTCPCWIVIVILLCSFIYCLIKEVGLRLERIESKLAAISDDEPPDAPAEIEPKQHDTNKVVYADFKRKKMHEAS